MASFTIPLTGSTIVATVTAVITYSTLVDCTDSATPMTSGDVCITMSYGGGSFTPDGTYDSLWDSRTQSVQAIPKKALVSMWIGLADYSMRSKLQATSFREDLWTPVASPWKGPG